MSVDIKDIKRLRELTGVGMTDAKQALETNQGNFDEALKEMRKKGLTKAEKRSEREARSGVIGTYNHDNRIGVIVEINCETDFVARNELFSQLVKDIAMQIAASNPEYLSLDDVSSDVRQNLHEEFAAKAKAEGKPNDKINQIIDGQIQKYLSEKCLLSQPFIKNPEQTVGDYVKDYIARLGENIVIRRFSRFALGEVS
jgi:elongation factor Ts